MIPFCLGVVFGALGATFVWGCALVVRQSRDGATR